MLFKTGNNPIYSDNLTSQNATAKDFLPETLFCANNATAKDFLPETLFSANNNIFQKKQTKGDAIFRLCLS